MLLKKNRASVRFGIFNDPETDRIFDDNFRECVEIVRHPREHKRISVATAVDVVRSKEPHFHFNKLALKRSREWELVAHRIYERYMARQAEGYLLTIKESKIH